MPLTHNYTNDHSLSWLDTGTSIKGGGVKLKFCGPNKLSLLEKRCSHANVFHVGKMLTPTYNSVLSSAVKCKKLVLCITLYNHVGGIMVKHARLKCYSKWH